METRGDDPEIILITPSGLTTPEAPGGIRERLSDRDDLLSRIGNGIEPRM